MCDAREMAIEEIDIYRSAQVLIDQYGDQAILEAMKRLERYHSIKNEKGASIWSRIANAIEDLEMPTDLKGESIN